MKPALLSLCVLALSSNAVAQPDSTARSVRVTVDPRIELMGVVQLLNGYRLVSRYDYAYKKDVQAYFEPYADHRAVELFGEMSSSGFSFSAVPEAMLALTEPPELAQRVPFSEEVVRRAGGADRLDEFVRALRAFAKDTDFDAFYAAHGGVYGLAVDSTREAAEAAVRSLSDYVGVDLPRTTIVLGMLLHHGGFAARYEPTPGAVEAYAFVGPAGPGGGAPSFGAAERMAGLVAHEFAHTVVKPLMREHADEVDRYAALFAPIEDDMRRAAYPEWTIAAEEHIVRAITTRLAYLSLGVQEGNDALAREEGRGFAYLRLLLNRLEAYERSRDQYPTLGDYFLVLLDGFGEATRER